MSVPDLPDHALRLGSGRGVDVVAPSSSLRSLADVLTPGERVSGRVVDRFANGDYLFALRGRTLVASSDVPLATDTVVTFEVLPDDGGAIRLRIAADPPAAGAPAGAPTPADLGLPDDALTRLALAAFAEADAPLDRARLQAAAQALAPLPADARPALADALASLAANELPATPALVSLAQRALAGPPSAASTLAAAATAFAAVPAEQLRTDGAAVTTGTMPPDLTRARATVAPAPNGAQADVIADSAARVDPRAPAPSAAATRDGAFSAAETAETPSSAAPSAATTPTGAATNAGAAAPTTIEVPSTARDLALRAIADLIPLPPDAGIGGAAAVRAALALVGVRIDGSIGGDHQPAATAGADASAPASTRAEDASAAPRSSAPAMHDVAPTRVAGEAPRAPAAAAPEATLLPRLGAAARALVDAHTPEARAALTAVAGAARELAGETALKPPSLADYDLVLPLPLTAHGEPAPARLAIARRAAANGVVATFLRVDVELSRLGRVSARLSGVVGGPLSVTIVADERARPPLAAGLDALESDLAARGTTARVRLVDPSESGDG